MSIYIMLVMLRPPVFSNHVINVLVLLHSHHLKCTNIMMSIVIGSLRSVLHSINLSFHRLVAPRPKGLHAHVGYGPLKLLTVSPYFLQRYKLTCLKLLCSAPSGLLLVFSYYYIPPSGKLCNFDRSFLFSEYDIVRTYRDTLD
jgi:hypothetical protein